MERQAPLRLFIICCDCLIPILENYSKFRSWAKPHKALSLLETNDGVFAQELLTRAVENANQYSKQNIIWKAEWRIFYTANIRSALVSWNKDVISELHKCQNLIIVTAVHFVDFDPSLVYDLPGTVAILIFDNKQKINMTDEDDSINWLAEAEEILKSLCNKRKIPIETLSGSNLTEVYLESVPAKTTDIQSILQNSPGLKVLRHYQLVKALYDLHADDWKKGLKVPVYRLKNIDADFSHVVRCRMSPGWVLAPDAFHLAVILCPQAEKVHLRFDCSTPNDVLNPLVNLARLRVFSAVCVTSGERTLLDFSDMAPILEKHGPSGLTYLELKVIEEVEVHIIIEQCTKLETLILSGCGYVTPTTCGSYECAKYKPGSFSHLRHIFFADGDDFSWDHGAPECFWRATLLPASSRHPPRIEGIFLEYPRIPDILTAQIFKRESADHQIPFPDLRVASVCRFGELTLGDVTAMCGLESQDAPPINFLRVSNCDQWDQSHEKSVINWFKIRGIECRVRIDGFNQPNEVTRPYTFKIFRPR